MELKESEEGKRIQLTDAFFIHLLDTGGQPSFQDVLPLLLDVPSTYVQVFNAALGLDERVPISYRSDDHTRVCLEEGAELGRDMILRSFSSMQTMANKRPSWPHSCRKVAQSHSFAFLWWALTRIR